METIGNRYDEMRAYHDAFFETGEIDPSVRPLVAQSWKRCRQYDVAADYRVERLSTGDREKLLKSNKDFIRIAHPLLMKLVTLVEGTQYVVTLHNRDGWILDYLFAGDNPVFSARGFDLGTLWSESTIGTCSSYLSTLKDTEVQLVGYEHYNERMKDIVGSAAPIHDEDGNLIGCVNMCGHYRSGNSHTLGLIKMTALLIEAQIARTRAARLTKDSFDMLPDGIVVLDEQYKVRQVTLQAATTLRMPQKAVYSLDFCKLFRREDFLERLEKEPLSFSYTEYELCFPDGRTLSCNVQVSPIISDMKCTGTIINFCENRVVNRLVNRVAGNRASYRFEDIVTRDAKMLSQIDMMKDIASTDCCVLIEGESGTGKELFAHSLHNASNRQKGPFIAVNCASLPRSLVESELFGYEKGSFTGARSEGSPGKFELADGGTIFLDEIGELPLEIQATLLRVLDNHKVVRIGGRSEKTLDVRVIAATNRNLYEEVQNGNFRSDLYFRINVLKFDIPPLQERKFDIPLLAQTFLERINEKGDAREKAFSQDCLELLTAYTWPGNVRELQNVVVRAYYACKGTVITAQELPANLKAGAPASPPPTQMIPVEKAQSFTGIMANTEKQAIADALRACAGDIEQAGARLGMSKTTVYRRMKKYGITLR